MDGILLIDKPKEWTSFDVVAKVRGILKHAQTVDKTRAIKVGHTGTLDPLATGLLVILIGKYTKKAPELSKADKTYEVTMQLGQTSTTGDDEGEKTVITVGKEPSLETVASTLMSFKGNIEQVPPRYSAIKVNGQRAYKLARAGKEVVIESRPVTIYDLTDVEYHYPEIKCVVRVSSGTYIRSLVDDFGKKLGTGAYMSDLRRSQVGEFTLQDALAMDGLGAETIYKRLINR